jgi:L-amino acid N-acyltransferase
MEENGSLIREANLDDCQAIALIYNQAIVQGNCTFDAYPVDESRYRNILDSDPRAKILIAERGSKVVGWASVQPISPRQAYRPTALGSLFVDERFLRCGIGGELKAHQLRLAAGLGYHSLVAEVLSNNPAGIALNLKFGYRLVGELLEAGFRNDQWIGLVILQKILDNT